MIANTAYIVTQVQVVANREVKILGRRTYHLAYILKLFKQWKLAIYPVATEENYQKKGKEVLIY